MTKPVAIFFLVGLPVERGVGLLDALGADVGRASARSAPARARP